MDESVVEVSQNSAQQPAVVEEMVQPQPPAAEVEGDFEEEDVAGDDTVSEAMATLEITKSQAVRDAVPQLQDYFAYKLMVCTYYIPSIIETQIIIS